MQSILEVLRPTRKQFRVVKMVSSAVALDGKIIQKESKLHVKKWKNLSKQMRNRIESSIENNLIPGNPDECWKWLGSVNGNKRPYGTVYIGNNKNGRAHRYVMMLKYGVIPLKYDIDHLCRNLRCCNPNHLEIVTKQLNILRGVGPTAVNASKTLCKNGHPFDIKVGPEKQWRYCSICQFNMNRARCKVHRKPELDLSYLSSRQRSSK